MNEKTESAVKRYPVMAVSALRCCEQRVQRTRKEEPEERADRRVTEELEPRETATCVLFLCMQRVQESADDQVLRPHHARRPDQVSPTKSREREPRQLRRENQQRVESIAELHAIVELRDDHSIERSGHPDRHVRHDVHQRVFLNVPRPWVERKFVAT